MPSGAWAGGEKRCSPDWAPVSLRTSPTWARSEGRALPTPALRLCPHVTCTLTCPGGSSLSSPFTGQPLPVSRSAPLCSGLWVCRLLIPGGALTAWPRSESPRALGAAACPAACPLPTLRKDWPSFSRRRSTSPRRPHCPPPPLWLLKSLHHASWATLVPQ